MAKYGRTASKTVKSAMHRKKAGTLRSSSGQRVTTRAQAIAIGLSEAREKGAKVPRATSAAKKTTKTRKTGKAAKAGKTAKTRKTRKTLKTRKAR